MTRLYNGIYKNGFTLIELLVVISIISVIVTLTMPNLFSARQRARDAKRKEEMSQFKSALRLYYNDYNSYPDGSGNYSSFKGCKSDGKQVCPCNTVVDFAAGGTTDGCDSVYTRKLPSDFTKPVTVQIKYYFVTGGDDFRLLVPLENASDPDIAASQARCPVPSTGFTYFASYKTNEYVICAD